MSILLSADWHLDDNPENAYRWDVFELIKPHIRRGDDLVLLGDIFDRKDRHSRTLVNGFIERMEDLRERTPLCRVDILMGNHDKPLDGVPYWSFLRSEGIGIEYWTAPDIVDAKAFLPYTEDPAKEWEMRGVFHPNRGINVIFMHQPINGARLENGSLLSDIKTVLPTLPNIPIYSGDIHVPQKLNGIEFVGAPHPIKFGDDYKCRLLRLNDQYEIADEIILAPIKKTILSISSADELKNLNLHRNDQVRIRMKVAADQITQWPMEQEAIMAWAKQNGVTVASCEADADAATQSAVQAGLPDALAGDPAEVFEAFCASESLDTSLVETGRALLREGLGMGK